MNANGLNAASPKSSMEEDFSDAYAALGALGLPDRLPFLNAAGLRISRQVLGGSHSVAIYPPVDSLRFLSPNQVLRSVQPGKEISLYVHVPFCETRCTFCHYSVRHYTGKGGSSEAVENEVSAYLAALRQELAFWGARLASSSTTVSSLYIGGGTPLVLGAQALVDLKRCIDQHFSITPGAELCIEGSPLTITAPDGLEKLRMLAAQGFTRLSFGVQSFDDAVLKYAGRGYRRDVAIKATEVAASVFDNWNLDLIQGLYRGSPQETWHNLRELSALFPAHLTWYHGRFANRPQGDWYQSEDRQVGFEDEADTLLGRMLIWRGMAKLGYQRCDGNRFVRSGHYVDPFKKVRTSASHDLLGVGVSSYSHLSARFADRGDHGYVFRNDPGIRTYIDRVAAGVFPIVSGRVIDAAELLAMSYATGLRRGRIEDDALTRASAQCPKLATEFKEKADRLITLGAIESYADEDARTGIRLSDLGRLFEDETLSLFFSPSVQRALALSHTDVAALSEVAKVTGSAVH